METKTFIKSLGPDIQPYIHPLKKHRSMANVANQFFMPDKTTQGAFQPLSELISFHSSGSEPAAALQRHDSVAEAGARMRTYGASKWPVAEGLKLVGMIDGPNPDWSIVKHGHDPNTSQVFEIMERPLVFCHADDDCVTAQERMNEHGLSHLPIVDQQMEIICILSREEILEPVKTSRAEEGTALHPALPARLKARSPGLGEASQLEIEERAIELALIDGRETASDADLARAAAELAGGGTTLEAPVADPVLEPPTETTDPPAQTGHLIAAAPLQDEDNIAEQLIEDGLEEAEHDSRVAAEYAEKDTRPADA